MVISWEKSVAAVIAADHERLDPDKSRPLGVMAGIRFRGGSEESKQQLHRGKAYFDRWLEKYPEYEGHSRRSTGVASDGEKTSEARFDAGEGKLINFLCV